MRRFIPTPAEQAILDSLDYLSGFALRRVRDGDLASDIVQEAVARLLQRHPPVRAEAVRMYLFRTVLNLCNDVRPESRVPADSLSLPADEAAAIGEADRIDAILALIAPDEADAVRLHVVDGLTYEEAADLTGLPASTIGTRCRRGLARLRRSLIN